jgi:predicted nuclease of restriction endonuclease-like (RecB) superfamily
MEKEIKTNFKLFANIRSLLVSARQNVLRQVNTAITKTYFEIGRLIVEDEQKGKARAKYGDYTLEDISSKLTIEFGKGFSVQNLERMRVFYKTYSISSTVLRKLREDQIVSKKFLKSSIRQTVSAEFKLSWSHYLFLMRLDERIRNFYEIEAIESNWSLREMKRQFDSGLYERLTLSGDKIKMRELSQKGQIIEKPQDLIKDPYILEFLGLEGSSKYSETDLEQALIDNIESFLLELGKGFTFVKRQERITFDDQHFFIDLVFYNRILKCFIVIDLKIGELKHQDLGQLQMYVNYFDRAVKEPDENPTIGIIICAGKNDAVVEMTLPKGNDRLFASKYKLYMPSKEEIRKQIRM